MISIVMKTRVCGLSRGLWKGHHARENICFIKRDHTAAVHTTTESQDGEWLNKLGDAQEMFVFAHRLGLRHNSDIYTLNARQPLSPEIVHKALKQLQMIAPHQQIVIRDREGEKWCFKPKKLDFEFKVHKKGTPQLDIIKQTWKPFEETKGPVYRAHLVPADEDDVCLFPEVKNEYPHQYYLICCQHHSIIDATTGKTTIFPLVRIINALHDGRAYDFTSPLGEFVSCEEFEELFSECKDKLSKDPKRLLEIKDKVERTDKAPILLKYFPRPNVEFPETEHISSDFNPKSIAKFIQKCKENGITFGNAFQTVTSTALIELIQETGGANEDMYDLSAHCSINIRRYMKARELPILGFHVRTMASLVTMGRNIRFDFWDNCRMTQRINNDLLNTKAPIEQDVIRRLYLPCVSPKDFFTSAPELTRDYGYNNIGSIPLQNLGRHVQLTELQNFPLIHGFIYPFYHQIISYGDKVKSMFSYATDCMTDDTANLLVSKIKDLLHNFSSK